MITLGNPLWLWGLLGLAVPIAIHLLSRKQGKTIYIGSLRHLTDSDTAQFSTIKLNEVLLLLLRLILVTLLVFILADVNFESRPSGNDKWVVVEKGIEKNPIYKKVIDTLTNNGFEQRWLANGFPPAHDSIPVGKFSYFEVIQSLWKKKIDSAVVLSFSYTKNFTGQVLPLAPNVAWLDVEPQEIERLVDVVQMGNDSVSARVVRSTATNTTLEYVNTVMESLKRNFSDSIVARRPDTTYVTIFQGKGFEYDTKIIQSSLLAIENAIADKIKITIIPDNDKETTQADIVFWFSNSPEPVEGKLTIGFKLCPNVNLPLLSSSEVVHNHCPSTNQFDWLITQRLNEENALSEELALKLSQFIIKSRHDKLANVLDMVDQRSTSNAVAFLNVNETITDPSVEINSANNSQLFLLIILLFILLTERIVAFKRNQ